MDIADKGSELTSQVGWMREALQLAQHARAHGDVPVGALVVAEDGEILGRGWNRREVDRDPSAHAEVVALREAAQLRGSWRLADATLIVTLEPCVMCAGAALLSRVKRIVLGTWDQKAGACGSVWDVVRDRRMNHWIEVVPGILQDECAADLRDFFAQQRGS